MWPSSVRWYKE